MDRKIDIIKAKRKNYFDFKKRFDVEPVFDKMRGIYRDVLDKGSRRLENRKPAVNYNGSRE